MGRGRCWTSTRPAPWGGTGKTFDWQIARQVAERYEFLLAGGLTPDNVGRAIATAAPLGRRRVQRRRDRWREGPEEDRGLRGGGETS